MKGYCVICNDGLLKDMIGKREDAMCKFHYWQKKRTRSEPIAKKSENQKKRDARYYPIRNEFLKDRKYCIIRIEGCTQKANQVHHGKGKEGELYFDTTFFIECCLTCHRWAEDHPEAARERAVSFFREK